MGLLLLCEVIYDEDKNNVSHVRIMFKYKVMEYRRVLFLDEKKCCALWLKFRFDKFTCDLIGDVLSFSC